MMIDWGRWWLKKRERGGGGGIEVYVLYGIITTGASRVTQTFLLWWFVLLYYCRTRSSTYVVCCWGDISVITSPPFFPIHHQSSLMYCKARCVWGSSRRASESFPSNIARMRWQKRKIQISDGIRRKLSYAVRFDMYVCTYLFCDRIYVHSSSIHFFSKEGKWNRITARQYWSITHPVVRNWYNWSPTVSSSSARKVCSYRRRVWRIKFL